MSKNSQNELLELGSVIGNGYSAVIHNAGKIIALITLIIAVLVTFTDIAFSGFGGEKFTSTLAIMLMSSYLMYFSLEDSGEREGETTEEYKIALGKFTDAKKRITPDDIDSLRSFCLDYSKRELEYRRLSYLGEQGYSASEYEEYKKGARFSRKAKKAFRTAEKMRAIPLSPSILMSSSHVHRKNELMNPRRKKIIGAVSSLIPSTVCMIFTVSVIMTTKNGLTPSAVIEGIVKLSALPVIGFKGMLDGYSFSKDDKSVYLESKARLLESFISVKNETEPNASAQLK